MKIFIVSKNGQPAHVTLCEVEAGEHFDQATADGEIGTTSLMAVSRSMTNTSILRREKHTA